MEFQTDLSFSHSADYSFIEFALKARHEPFETLVKEFERFEPRKISDFSLERQTELARLKKFNPEKSEENLLEFIDKQIALSSIPEIQLVDNFADRVMSEYVTVAFLVHALTESAINTLLAIGLSVCNAPELFSLLERADLKEKWIVGPKAFHPTYNFPKDGALYETLQHLITQRNLLVHYKVELEVDGKKTLKGSRLDRAPLKDQLVWIRRFFSLPYDLVLHAKHQIPQLPISMLYESNPIPRYKAHIKS